MSRVNFHIGEIIKGKWSENSYKIFKLLGEGGIGSVYGVIDLKTNQKQALKISTDLQSITREYEMLKRFQHIRCIPKVMELDDYYCRNSGDMLHYIVMEYIQGKNLKEYVKHKSIDIKGVVGLVIVIAKWFDTLHKNNLVFGDLKLENIMIDEKNWVLKIIDLGGVTPIGCSIREFTPLYDRASWNMGIRKADEKYDLFSLSMLLTTLLLKDKLDYRKMDVYKLTRKLKNVGISFSLTHLIHRGLQQNDISFSSFLMQLEKIYKKGKFNFVRLKFDKESLLVNGIFIGSILLFVGMISILVRKSILF